MTSTQFSRGGVLYLGVLLLGTPFPAHADVYRWDTREVIPGTEGIEPGPGVQLDHRELQYANLREMDLLGADFAASNLSVAHLTNTDLRDASLRRSTLTGADLQGADLEGSDLAYTDFTGADLTCADLDQTNAWDNTIFTDALIMGATFTDADIKAEQLYSTASYKMHDLRGVGLADTDLAGWDFSDQDLSGAYLAGVNYLPLENVILTNASIAYARFSNVAKEQIYSTTSYQQKNLQGIQFYRTDLSHWSFIGQNLILADFSGTNLDGADLRAANLQNANLQDATFDSIEVNAHTTYNQWTTFPRDFDPQLEGLTLIPAPPGDFDANGVLDAEDIDTLAIRLSPAIWNSTWKRHPYIISHNYYAIHPRTALRFDAMFDVNGDTRVDRLDFDYWVHSIKQTTLGDANLDGEFNSGDFVQVFEAGKYETQRYAAWAEGDWNADGIFSSSDMVAAFVDGGYEKGLRTPAATVPEPTSLLLLMAGLIGIAVCWR